MGAAAPFIAIGASALSTGLGAIGQIQQGNAQAAQASYQAQVARNSQEMLQRNAAVLEQNAQYAEQQGILAEDRQRQKTAQRIGSQRAALAGQGGDINDGSDVDLIGDTARAGEFDALTIRNNTRHQIYGIRLQKMNAENQASFAGAQSGMYSQAAAAADLPFAVGSSLLSSASSLAGRWKGLWN